ncbi:hypothetical protein B0J12DRAFT_246133 [Macrophomina phaseolina]|uniref:Uncharacterized protein n=1 Tax=Macrophomina phaseolina TaxID=35725 RepID=A0ABQ8G0A5_9PEZI|nr:hypothetical protein B0J12DRAFT_246133 [Macrophomina phaseolina]
MKAADASSDECAGLYQHAADGSGASGLDIGSIWAGREGGCGRLAGGLQAGGTAWAAGPGGLAEAEGQGGDWDRKSSDWAAAVVVPRQRHDKPPVDTGTRVSGAAGSGLAFWNTKGELGDATRQCHVEAMHDIESWQGGRHGAGRTGCWRREARFLTPRDLCLRRACRVFDARRASQAQPCALQKRRPHRRGRQPPWSMPHRAMSDETRLPATEAFLPTSNCTNTSTRAMRPWSSEHALAPHAITPTPWPRPRPRPAHETSKADA